MGQKVHPYGFRLGYTKTWNSRWFAKQGYVDLLKEDLRLKTTLRTRLKGGPASVRSRSTGPGNKLRITIRYRAPRASSSDGAARKSKNSSPKSRNGRSAKSTSTFRKCTARRWTPNWCRSRSPCRSRNALRSGGRCAKPSTRRCDSAAGGIKIWVAGRLNGHEIARTEWYLQGRLPLQTLRADIDYGFSEAHTTYGVIGVKCWMYRGEIIDTRAQTLAAGGMKGELEPARRREARSAAERERERIRASRTGRSHPAGSRARFAAAAACSRGRRDGSRQAALDRRSRCRRAGKRRRH